MTFDLHPGAPAIHSIDVAGDDTEFQTVAEELAPVYWLRVGQRDLKLRDGWTIFFDRMQDKPHEVHRAELASRRATVSSHGNRATVTLGDVTAGPFQGELRWTFFAGERFALQEAVLHTEQDGVAYLYDAGLVCQQDLPQNVAWYDAAGPLQLSATDSFHDAQTLAVRGRAIAAQFASGSLAVFPPPHQYFYPLDYSTNLKNIWAGPGYRAQDVPFGFGIRHEPRGDRRFVPWFNAPPGTRQELGLFLAIAGGSADALLDDVAGLTRHDQFDRLPGYKTFTSHYHVEHTQAMLDAQDEAPAVGDATGRSPSGQEYRIPQRFIRPGFVDKFGDLGVDIVHLAEFHFGRTPRLAADDRLKNLALLHAECRRLSDDALLLLPGEEPNVHLGGHWISLFPQPVYWVLNRPPGTAFVTEDPQLGRIYHVGSEADVHRLLQQEHGLAWTAHPRIKGSTGFPDGYRDRPFFLSERFLGAAWKAMPADLSQPRLGTRALDLFDDMENWGAAKQVLGEVDVFQIEPTDELYGHMNVNYLRLASVPRFDDGWQTVLDALRGGRFFVTTGEVLVPEFTVDAQPPGETLRLGAGSTTSRVEANLAWTFPLAFAEVIFGDGRQTTRKRIDLSHTGSHGSDTFTVDVDLTGARWVRFEAWDVATNGAFTQPVWIDPKP